MNKKIYKKELHSLQVELVKFQKSVIEKGKKVCIIFKGRDAAGKDEEKLIFSKSIFVFSTALYL